MASLDFEQEKNSFREYYGSNYPLLKAAEESFRTLVASLLAGNKEFPTPVVSSRLKDREECISKFIRKYQSDLEERKEPYEIKDYITDLIGVRVTCYYEIDVPHIRRILDDNFHVIEVTDKTSKLESRDDTFGYKGLHLDLDLNEDRRKLPEYRHIQEFRFEVQIRTIIQHAWSELDHKIKYKKSPPQSLKRSINRLAALFEFADKEFVSIRLETEERERQATTNSSDATVSDGDKVFLASLQNLSRLVADYSGASEKHLDAFQFISVAGRNFPGYTFSGEKVDGFVQELHALHPNITKDYLEKAFAESMGKVREYAQYQSDENYLRLNPYTMIRHALYLYDKEKFYSILFDMQRQNFEEWLSTGSVYIPYRDRREPRW